MRCPVFTFRWVVFSLGGWLIAPAIRVAAQPPAAAAAPAPKTAARPEAAAATEAQQPSEPRQRSEPIEVRIVGSRPDGVQRIPGSGTVITEKDIQRAQPYDSAEMLRRVPGVQVRQDYGGGNRLDLSIRGLEGGRARKVLILEDGMPIAVNPYAESDLYFAPAVERMRSIEVVKGSGNILFGPQTLVGVVNFLTIAPPNGRKVTVDAEGGQRAYFRGLANYGDSIGNVRYFLQTLYKRGDGFRDVGFNIVDVLGKVAFDTSSKGELVLKLSVHSERNDSDAVGLTRQMYDETPDRSRLATNDRMNLGFYQLGLTHEQRFTPRTKLTTLAYAYRTDRVWRRQNYSRTFDPAESYERIVGDTTFPNGAIFFKNNNTVLDRSYNVLGVEPRLQHHVPAGRGGLGHTIDVGGRFLTETAAYQQRTGGNPTTFDGSLDYAENHRTWAAAAYLQDRIELTKDLLLTPGVRYEFAALGRTITRQNTSSGPTDVNINANTNATGIIPGVNLLYGDRRAQGFGGVHVGWAPPRISNVVNPSGGTPVQLDPERSINYELGSRFSIQRWLRLEGAGFLSDFQNQVIANTEPGAATEQTNAGKTRIIGLETSSVLGFGALFDWRTQVDLGARYTFAHSAFAAGDFKGNLLPYAPLHSFNTNLDIEHPSGIGGQIAYAYTGAQFTDSRNTEASDTTGRVGRIGGRHILDVTLHYTHKPTGLSARLSVKNALNDLYIVSRRPEGIFAAGFVQVVAGLRWTYSAL